MLQLALHASLCDVLAVLGVSKQGVSCRLKPYPALYETFMIEEGGTWRPPAVNETCCVRPQLAATLQRIADGGPDAIYTGQAGQVLHHASPLPPQLVTPHPSQTPSSVPPLPCLCL